MVRLLSYSLTLLVSLSQLAHAQDDLFSPPPESPSKAPSEKESAEPNEEWKPAFRVFLNEHPGTFGQLESRTVMKHQTRTVYESVRQSGQTLRIPRAVVQAEQQVVESVTSGVSLIDCDAIDVHVKTGENESKTFEFDIKGSLRLRNGTSVISAKSAKLSEGKLTLTDVSIENGELSITSTEVVLELTVTNLRIGDASQPLRIPVTPDVPAYGAPGLSPFSPPAAQPSASFEMQPMPLRDKKKSPGSIPTF